MARSVRLQRPAARRSISTTLAGLQVLIVEDDYHLAMDAKAVLEGAGAKVIGPVPKFELVEKALADRRPDCAVVDINLGAGPTFATAQRLQADAVPFMFLTGYTEDAVPTDFREIPRALKPASPESLVQAVLELATPAP